MNFKNLRKKYPRFVYENYSYGISGKDLKISFDFAVAPDIKFNPKIIVENAGKNLPKTALSKLNNLIFHLGLVEMISYWKATCSPIIEIKAGSLNKEQINFWQDLILNGMGQFFFENKISFQKPKIITSGPGLLRPGLNTMGKGILVPVGGGKDSVVTLEILKKTQKNILCFSLNPSDSARKIMKIAGCKNPVIVRRKIDETLLELNRKGFLNGHTPFSAYLAFLSVLAAAISGKKYVALSNERSSNEGNVKYLGKMINHQWSKTFEFENNFRKYSKKYLVKNIEYFSFLRPLYEIQIAKIFSKYAKYFSAFLSCNEAYKTASGTKKPTKRWCGKCSKCLFVFAILYPFVKEKELLKIFGKNLFEDKPLLPIMQELIGERGFKPFECVGTKKESLLGFYLSLRKSRKLPILLKYFKKKILLKYPNLEKESKLIMNSWNKQNNLSKEFIKILSKIS
ncbi:MAG: hypothetical protein PHE52_01255 [Candidatus Pacebacteria bacterium]|nr:hypothetical protein [Candidatus Paceibacterota bacterium]